MPSECDLLWLKQEMLNDLCSYHHGPLDDKETTGTEINIHQQAVAIAPLLRDRLNKLWAINHILDMYENGRTRFKITRGLLDACRDLDIDIPFSEIREDTYEKSVLRIVTEARERIEGSPHQETIARRSKER